MSRTIDEKVVEMQFDNSNFEKNVKTSMSTLDQLKQSLKLDHIGDSFSNISKAAGKVDLSSIGSSAETVGSKFSALEVMAVTALANITNSAVNAGKRLVASLTIEPIKQGFGEYELKMGSVQTIMASTGASLDEVNNYLEELNHYADRTIYSFSDMTTNIGKFTNAGVKLKDAVAAIQGVSNVAAVSGANANEASRAMYNFAQALSAGYVKLIDWKSIENANMATVEFKNQLLETAEAAGTVTKTADGMYQTLKGHTFDATHNFNDVLQDQWMTTEVLVATLNKYADETTEIGKKAFAAAQDVKTFTQLLDTLKEAAGSGWAQTWEILFGDFEEAKALWTSVNEVVGGFIDRMSNARNSILQEWKDLGGRAELIQALSNVFDKLRSVFEQLGVAINESFEALTGKDLYNITHNFLEFTKTITISDGTLSDICGTFHILTDAASILGKGIKVVFQIFKNLIKVLEPVLKLALKIGAALGEMIYSINFSIGDTLVGITSSLDGLIDPIVNGASKAVDKIGKLKINLEGISQILHRFSKDGIVEHLLDTVNSKLSFLEPINKEHIEQLKQIGRQYGYNSDKFKNAVKIISNWDEKLEKIITRNVKILDLFTVIRQKVSSLWVLVSNILSKGLNFASGGIFAGILIGIKTIIDKLKSEASSGIGGIIDKIKEKLNLGQVQSVLDSVRGSLEAFQKNLQAKTLLKIGEAIALLAGSILVLSLINPEQLGKSLGVLTSLMIELVSSMFAFSKMNVTSSFGKITTALIKVGVALLLMSAALAITAGAMKTFAKVAEDGSAWKGLGLMAASLGVMLGALLVLSKLKSKILLGASSVLVMSAALVALGLAIGMFAAVANMDNVWKGFGLMAASLGILVISLSILADMSSKIIIGAAAMVLMASALTVLSVAMGVFSLVASMKSAWEGLGLMAASLAILMGSMELLSLMGPKILLGAAAMLVMSSALAVLAVSMGAFAIIASMNSAWEGLGLMAASLALLTIACLGLSAIAVPVLTGAAVMLVMSVALAALGGAIAVVSLALPMLSAAFIGLGPAILALAKGIGEAIAYLAASVGAGLDGLLNGIAAGIEEIIAAVGKGIGMGLEGIGNGISAIGDAIGNVGDGIGDIGDGIERFGNGVRSLDGISWIKTAGGIKEIAGALKDLNKNKFDGDTASITNYLSTFNLMVNQIVNSSSKMKTAGSSLSRDFGNALVNGLRSYYNSAYSSGQYLADGLISGINSKTSAVRSAASSLGNAASQSLRSSLKINSPSKITEKIGNFFGLGFINKIKESTKKAKEASSVMGNESVESLKNTLLKMSELILNSSEASPTIKPVLDLSDIRTGADEINSIISDDIDTFGGSYRLAKSIGSRTGFKNDTNELNSTISKFMDKIQNGESGNTTNNVFNIHGDDPKTIAGEVSRILQAQVERRNASWA